MTVNHYLGDYHLTFTHNKGATDRSKAVGNVINGRADKLDRNATYVSAHDGPEGKVYLSGVTGQSGRAPDFRPGEKAEPRPVHFHTATIGVDIK